MTVYSLIYHIHYNMFRLVIAAITALAKDGCNYRPKKS